ncbi:MAG: hypothetical protein JOZ01_09495 [Candidatus Eremiobacteraeota bacterium]|nr:hypothetical protein [Candidatus Eremiobacteraeota bacterium]
MGQPSVSDFLAGLAADPDAVTAFDADRASYLKKAGFTDPDIIAAFTKYKPDHVRTYVQKELGAQTDRFWDDNQCHKLTVDDSENGDDDDSENDNDE